MATGIEASTTVGVTGQSWRASVSPWGSVTPWGGVEATLEWFVAADDRWHRPAREAAVRQRRIDGTPVVETRLRVPDGDAVQRVWSVADAGGLTIVEVYNDSPLPFALAVSGIDVLTERPVADVPIQGIDLPPDAITLPVGHHTSVRVAIPHGADITRFGGRLPSVHAADAVVRGWVSVVEQASSLDLPDDRLTETVVAARCDLMLSGPIDADLDPLGFVFDVGELVRLGDDPAAWLGEIVGPIESVARSTDNLLPAALVAAQRLAIAARDPKAERDIGRLRDRAAKSVHAAPLGPFSDVRRSGSVGRFVHDVERRLASGGDLLAAGIPTSWLGVDFEVHGVPTSESSTVSYAVRWHGARPAVLWEQSGVGQRLTATAVDPAWTTSKRSGEGLWAAPARMAMASKLPVASTSTQEASDSTSFS